MDNNQHLSRQKFLSWGVGLASLMAFPMALFGRGKKKAEKPVKLLTADGKLVQVDEKVLEAARQHKKASNQEIYNWMNNPSKP